MGAYQKEWARRARAALFDELGRRCNWCARSEGDTDHLGRAVKLTFDCIIPQGDSHHRGSTDQRVCFYRRQHKLGNVQVLCHSCNSAKGDKISFHETEPDFELPPLIVADGQPY